jgi:hypothetical protein
MHATKRGVAKMGATKMDTTKIAGSKRNGHGIYKLRSDQRVCFSDKWGTCW